MSLITKTFSQFVAQVASDVAKVIFRTNEIELLKRLNNQLSLENNKLTEFLREERSRYDELKAAFDNHLGLTSKADNDVAEIHAPIGGYESYSRRARNLSLVSARKLLDAESNGSEIETGSEA